MTEHIVEELRGVCEALIKQAGMLHNQRMCLSMEERLFIFVPDVEDTGVLLDEVIYKLGRTVLLANSQLSEDKQLQLPPKYHASRVRH